MRAPFFTGGYVSPLRVTKATDYQPSGPHTGRHRPFASFSSTQPLPGCAVSDGAWERSVPMM